MVQAVEDDEWPDNPEDGDDGWGDWEEPDDQMAALEEPGLARQGSSFQNASDIYSTKRRTDLRFITTDNLRTILSQRIERIIDYLGVSDDFARALLLKNDWNEDKAMKNFSEDPDYCRKTFNFFIGENEVPKDVESVLCPVCFCDYGLDEMIYIKDCGHGLCNYCFTGYLTSKVGDGCDSAVTTCPEQKCNMIVPERLFEQLLERPLYERYKSFFVKSFVDLSDKAKWCPGRDCVMAVEYLGQDPIDVTCEKCQKAFCFACTKDAHMPIDCDGLLTWLDRINKGDDDTATWMKLNTKPCPKCKRPIQKNQGCMHMTCSQCRHEFCWLCLGDYRNHQAETGQGLCNSFEDVQKAGRAQDMTEVQNLERELKRLEHYSTRYIEHQKSIAHAEKALEMVKLQVASALELNPKYNSHEFQFLIDIAGLVVAARRSLSYTYAIRFYLKGLAKQAFFDFIQGDLEKSLEALNKRSEESWLDKVSYDPDGTLQLTRNFIDYKQQIQQLREAVEEHFNKVMSQIMQGLPDITEVEDVDEDVDYTFDGTNVGQWTCRVCQVKNQQSATQCSTCRTQKPKMVYKPGQKKQGGIQITGAQGKKK